VATEQSPRIEFALGVMQGRLLPKYRGRYQAHPVGYWEEEFDRARELGLALIEFILDYEGAEMNPLLTDDGQAAITAATRRTGVQVRSVCADYFMEAPLHGTDGRAVTSAAMLGRLIDRVARLGVEHLVIPCVDQSTLADAPAVDRFVAALKPFLGLARERNVRLSLETDLPPGPFRALLDRFDSPFVTVNYDIGNSASLGYDPAEEVAAYGDRISDIHVKDRVRGGGSVRLGTGDADFDRFFEALQRVGYRGPLILQAYRDDEGVTIFREQLAWLRERLPAWTR
jgi:sugar phosphate isomerase/epimerase